MSVPVGRVPGSERQRVGEIVRRLGAQEERYIRRAPESIFQSLGKQKALGQRALLGTLGGGREGNW